jgi:dynein heavy chain
MEYIPVAVRTQILFFCVSDLANVDPMYQYSLEWFLNIFLSGIANSERAGSSSTLRWMECLRAHFSEPSSPFTFTSYTHA